MINAGASLDSESMPILAGVLVGGSSRRMGRDKATFPHPQGGTFAGHVIGIARLVTPHVVLLGSNKACSGWPVSCPLVPDAPGANGPMAGLHSLLAAAGGGDVWCLLLACDLPLLDARTLERLVHAAAPRYDVIAFARVPGRVHTCCALYHARLARDVAARVSQKRLSLQALVHERKAHILEPDIVDRISLTNVNTPADLASLDPEVSTVPRELAWMEIT